MIRFLVRFMAFLPLIEVVLIVLVWHALGPWWTLALLFSGSLAGLAVLRLSPIRTLDHLRAQLQRGQAPNAIVWDGMALGVAGLLLLVPGFFSDFLAVALLLGPGRRLLRRPRGVDPPPTTPAAEQKPLEGRFRTYRD